MGKPLPQDKGVGGKSHTAVHVDLGDGGEEGVVWGLGARASDLDVGAVGVELDFGKVLVDSKSQSGMPDAKKKDVFWWGSILQSSHA